MKLKNGEKLIDVLNGDISNVDKVLCENELDGESLVAFKNVILDTVLLFISKDSDKTYVESLRKFVNDQDVLYYYTGKSKVIHHVLRILKVGTIYEKFITPSIYRAVMHSWFYKLKEMKAFNEELLKRLKLEICNSADNFIVDLDAMHLYQTRLDANFIEDILNNPPTPPRYFLDTRPMKFRWEGDRYVSIKNTDNQCCEIKIGDVKDCALKQPDEDDLSIKYPHYHKSVKNVERINLQGVLDLFGIDRFSNIGTCIYEIVSKHFDVRKCVNVKHLKTIDVYEFCELFDIDDKSSRTQHALKKLLLAGKRGAKDQLKDFKEAIATLKSSHIDYSQAIGFVEYIITQITTNEEIKERNNERRRIS